VDTEDLQLNVSRESIQSSRVIAQIKRALTGKVLETLKKLAFEEAKAAEETTDAEKPVLKDGYTKFWNSFSRYIKEGIATDPESLETLPALLRFHSLKSPEKLISLDDYIAQMKSDQKKIYYILSDDERAAIQSPHLDVFHKHNVDVLLMADPIDAFVMIALTKYKDYPMANAAIDKPELQADVEETGEAETKEAALPEDQLSGLVARFKDVLGDRVSDVRATDRLIESPARLVDPEGAPNQEIQRAYRAMRQELEAPKKVLEINPRHPILKRLSEQEGGSDIGRLIVEQIFEDALLIEGLHPNPAGMIQRIQELMRAALK
jgi:molecular chaperone HtpG